MKYQLKDKIMWAGLIKIDGFEKNFQEACAREMPDNLKTILVDITGRDYCGQLEFAKTEIVESDDFSPHAWNDYLKTKPPRAGIWRVEAETADDDYFAGEMQEGGFWIDHEGRRISPEKIKRFALWAPDAKEENGVARRAALAAYREIREHVEEK